MDESKYELIVDSFDAYVDAADEILGLALGELYRQPGQCRLIQDIRKHTVRLLHTRQVQDAVAVTINGLGTARALQAVAQLQAFASPGDDERDQVWRRLDAARAVLRACQFLCCPEVPADAQALLLKFDVLLAGATGEPEELWTSAIRRLARAPATRPA